MLVFLSYMRSVEYRIYFVECYTSFSGLIPRM